MAYEAQHDTGSLARMKLVREAGVEPATFGLRSSALTALSFSRMEPRDRLELAFPDYKSGASPSMLTRAYDSGTNGANRTLIGRLPCDCPSTELHRLEPEGTFETPPPRYGCGALPLELLRRGASAENRTPLIGLAVRCPTNRPHPHEFWSGRRKSKSLLWVGGPGHTLYTTPAHFVLFF
jgi:hypothetical protein